MNLDPTPEQQALKDAVRRFCGEQIGVERVRSWERLPSGVDMDLWRAAADMGWFGLGLASDVGGMGLGLAEIGCVLEECARGLVARPLINAITHATLAAELDLPAAVSSGLASGRETISLAFDELHTRHPAQFATRLSEHAGAGVVSGSKAYVADAAQADWHVVAARDPHDELIFVLVRRPGESALHAVRTGDGERQAHVDYERVPVVACLGRTGQGEIVWGRLQARRQALALAEILGAMDAALTMTVAYVKEREQFGQKIAVFQAVQHQVADMAMALTAARHLTWQAITGLEAGEAAAADLAAACAFVGPAAKQVTLAAHHLHGGAGYVVEHPLHLHSERVQALCIRHIPERDALAAVASALLD